MNGLERTLCALGRKEPDRVPIIEDPIDPRVIKALHGDISYADFVDQEDLDAIICSEDQKTEKLGSNIFRDEWGIVFRIGRDGIRYPIDGPIKSEHDLDHFCPPDPDAPWRFETLKRYVKRFKGEKAIILTGNEDFTFSRNLMGGMEKIFVNYILRPRFVRRLSEIVSDCKSKELNNAVDVGADILRTGDDYAGAKGSLMSPQHFREFILPYLQQAVKVAEQNNVPFIKHSDGNLWNLLDMIVDTGIDALNPLEPRAKMDIGEVKEKYGERIALVGNIDCAYLLPYGTKTEVIEAVKETIAKGSVDGGHILASSNSIHPGVNPENYRIMIQTAKRFGVYPLDPKMVQEYKNNNYIARFLDEE